MLNGHQRFASSVTELCRAIPVSPTWYYFLRKLPNAPRPLKDGRHSIRRWRAFSKKHQPSQQKVVTEKRQLELQLMRAKVEKHQWELGESQDATRKEVLAALTAEFERALYVLRSHFEKVRLELSPRFAGLPVRSIYTLWRQRENQMLKDVVEDLEARTGTMVKVRAVSQSSNGLNGNGGREVD
jgi:hypothetical protein